MQEEGTFNHELLESIFHTSKKTIQEYVREIERHNRYRSVRSNMLLGTILDDRARLIDLYDACLQQDAHIRAVIETLESQILGDRYMLARLNDKGKYVKDVKESQKIQGSQFDKIIRGIIEAKLYGYTLLEIMPDIDPDTGRLKEVNSIERRNVLPEQGIVVKRQGQWRTFGPLGRLPEALCAHQDGRFGTLLGHDATYPRQKVYDCELLEFQPFIRSADYSRKDRQRKQHGSQASGARHLQCSSK